MALSHAWNPPALAWLSLVLVLSAEGSQRCQVEGECACLLHKSTRLSRLMEKQAEDLRTTYMSSQGDFSEMFCKLSVKEVPRAEITGYGTLERLRSVHTTLGLFRQHIAVVTEEQKNLQDSENPLLKELLEAQDQIANLDASVRRLLQTLHPNEPPEVAGPGRGPAPGPARNTFQQKIYGCAVLTNHRDFLSHVWQELKDLKLNGQTCVSRKGRSIRGARPRTS
ncbi:IL-6 subfamily cytokine M17 [Anguilla anguilla]|uniref:IL-6 subfamily cytokine M17 n=1 Tax=Anguilla anguilla TaxID=7936 RepID=UPI0015AE3188|nr:IL-6 subfamily cytokine M17 [Anguilla anguilla]